MKQSQQILLPSSSTKFSNDLQQYKNFFASNNTYHTQYQHHKQLICKNNTLHVLYTVIAIRDILADGQADPFSKLLCLRFFKDVFSVWGSYALLTMVNSTIIKQLWQLIMKVRQQQMNINRKQQLQDNRGQTLFLGCSKQYQNQYLRRIGVSCYKIILQMLEQFSQLVPYCPYDEQEYKMVSAYSYYYKLLSNLQIAFIPEQKRTYYKTPTIKKLTTIFTNMKLNKQQVTKFYSQLMELLNHSFMYQRIKDIVVQIVESGDQFCVSYCVKVVKQIIEDCLRQEGQVAKFDYLDFTDGIIMTGDIQVPVIVQKQLLLNLVKLQQSKATKSNEKNKITGYLYKWTKVLADMPIAGQGYRLWRNAYKDTKFDFKKDVELYQNMAIKMRQKNIIKQNNMKFQGYDLSQLQQVLKLPKIQNIKSKGSNKQLKLTSNLQQNSCKTNRPDIDFQNKFQQILTITPEIQLLNENYLKTPKFKASSRFISVGSQISQSSNSKYQTPNNSKYHKDNNSRRSSLYNIKINFDASSKNSQYFQSNNQASQLQSKHMLSQQSRSQYGLSGSNKVYSGLFNKDYDILKHQIYQSQKKQMQLQQQLKKKDEIIKSMASQNPLTSPSTNHFKSTKTDSQKNQVHKQTFFSAPDKIISQFYTSSAAQFKSINKDAKQSYKWKKDLLKRKILLFKNSLIQVGLITKYMLEQNSLECKIFVTPFAEIINLEIQAKCRGNWLRIKGKSKQMKQQASPQKQHPAEFVFISNIPPLKSSTQPPMLSLNFKAKYSPVAQSYEVEMPIKLNKLLESVKFELSDYLKMVQSLETKKSTQNIRQVHEKQYSRNCAFDPKICKCFQDFTKYFPNALKVENQGKKYVALIKGIGMQFYFQASFYKAGDAIFRFFPKQQHNTSIQLLKQIINLYCQLFSK